MVETNNPLQSLQRELETRLAERAAIDQKIKAVRRSIKVLEPLYGGVRPSGVYPMSILAKGPMGITDRIREVLKANPNQALAPTRVRDLMLSFGFDIPNGPNPMATIHTILKRIAEDADSHVDVVEAESGGSLYTYIPPPPPSPEGERKIDFNVAPELGVEPDPLVAETPSGCNLGLAPQGNKGRLL